MPVASTEWTNLIEQEYISDFITAGGAAVKFAVGDDERIAAVAAALRQASRRHDMIAVTVDGAAAKLHMIQDVFFALARALDWNALAQSFVEALFAQQGYQWPCPGRAAAIHRVAECNRVDVTLLHREVRQWLTGAVMRDTEMTQDFRVAMTQLCLHRLEPEDTVSGITIPIVEWLRGELRQIGALRDASITARITRHNGRAMLRSLCRWLRLCGRRGLCLCLDIRQLAKTGSAVGAGIKYSPAAVMDGFEVLRQLIDDAEHFTGLLLVVFADEALIGDDPKRSVAAYQALKMRIWDDVRAEHRDNPLAPLVRLAALPIASAAEAAG
ncbi:MAG TPA: BREX system ATP-binding domain-containing protein [Stellaceae bacterium]|nr:BREX system ATP-binding domain-containing protein [Stellaceae bacterium]